MSLGGLQTEADLERWLLARFPGLRAAQSTVLLWGEGDPSGAPSAPRAIYVKLDGGVGTTFWVWTGAAWDDVA